MERILDAGSGSGILAVASVLLGADRALGFDVDPNAKPYADALARDNGVGERCEFVTGGFDVLASESERFDGLHANLHADLLREELPRLERALRRGGWFALSGCVERNATLVSEAISDSDLRVDETRVRGRWHTFVGSRAGPAPR